MGWRRNQDTQQRHSMMQELGFMPWAVRSKIWNTYLGRNPWKIFKKSFHSSSSDGLCKTIKLTSGLYLVGHVFLEFLNTDCCVTHETKTIKLWFRDKAPGTWTQSFVSYCGQKDPIMMLGSIYNVHKVIECHSLFWIIHRVGEESWINTSFNSINALDYNSISVCM